MGRNQIAEHAQVFALNRSKLTFAAKVSLQTMSDTFKQGACGTVSNPENSSTIEVRNEERNAQETGCPKSGSQEKQSLEIKPSQVK